jgi:flagellar motility protein MotE (MotC chaperone)
MRHVLPALLFLFIGVSMSHAQMRATDETESAPSDTADIATPPQAQQKPVDLHADSTKRAKAEARAHALHALPEVRMFCSNTVSIAGAARVAWQASKLQELEARLQQKIDELEAKRAEYEAWMQKREDALKKANDQIVAIYSKMAPEAAANELSQMDDALAAAVLVKLNTRSASAILGEMDPARAAHLTDEMVGANLGDGKKS